MDDQELVERARRGDRAAFGDLVDRHRAAVLRAVSAALGGPDEADDVAQEALVTAFARLSSFREESSFRTWLLTIAWHKALDRRKARTRRVRRLQPFRWAASGDDPGAATAAVTADPPAHTVSPEEAMARSELLAHARRLVLRLPPRLRHALLLAGSGEYSYEEAARILAAPVGTVKWRAAEARRRVKAQLARLGYHDE